jgi:hypothetical protein
VHLVACVKNFALFPVLQDNLYQLSAENFSHKSPRKPPYRPGYKSEIAYPNKGERFFPRMDVAPVARLIMVRTMTDPGPHCESYVSMRMTLPKTTHAQCLATTVLEYRIPLILINKQLAFYEAQCHPDDTPLPPSSSCGIKQREMREYTVYVPLVPCVAVSFRPPSR